MLDVACGTGVVAVTAARRGAKVSGLDLSPALIERARKNASIAGVEIDFIEGDAEALPYPDASFDVVLSQFGHIFAPRPAVVVKEMLRVLKAGGRIAFSTWPPEHFTGANVRIHRAPCATTSAGRGRSSPAAAMGRSERCSRERLGAMVTDLEVRPGNFGRAGAQPCALSRGAGGDDRPADQARRRCISRTIQTSLRKCAPNIDAMAADIFEDNTVRMPFLMSRATKL